MKTGKISTIQDIRNRLHAAQKPLLVSHVRPDGDAVASIVGMGTALQQAGKTCQLVLLDGVPSKYRFLNGSQLITNEFKDDYDLVVALDCSDKKRLGSKFEEMQVNINIDHHITNEYYADLNLVLPGHAATCAVLAEYLPKWDFPIEKDIAVPLLMGILTDSIGFRTCNVTPQTLRLSAKLMEKGANLYELYEKALISQTFQASMLWGLALSKIKKEGGIAWTTITREDRKTAGYPGRDDADLTNFLSSLEKIDISILLHEQKDGKVKVSWRSGANIDVSLIAQRFGGGGHPPASGAEILGNLEEVEEMVLMVTKQYLLDFESKGEQEHG
jgi:phosphoesterase RecJ-like protein